MRGLGEMTAVLGITDQLFASFYICQEGTGYHVPQACEPEKDWLNGKAARLVSERRTLCKPDWVEHHISRPINRADGLMSRLPGGRRETTELNDWRMESER